MALLRHAATTMKPMAVEGGAIQVIGGTAPVREAIKSAFGIEVDGESVAGLADALDTAVVVVVTSGPDQWDDLTKQAKEPGQCVIAVLPELETGNFVRAFRLGAAGAVWEDTPTSHLSAITRSALRKDIVLPRPVFTAILTNQISQPGALDAPDIEILDQFAAGHSQANIASNLGYSKRTLQRRIANLCLGLGATNPTQAVHLATKNGHL